MLGCQQLVSPACVKFVRCVAACRVPELVHPACVRFVGGVWLHAGACSGWAPAGHWRRHAAGPGRIAAARGVDDADAPA